MRNVRFDVFLFSKMGMSISKALMFILQICFDWPNTMFSRYGEYNYLDVVRHVIGGENYKWVIRNDFVWCSMIVLEIIYCASLRVCLCKFYICIL